MIGAPKCGTTALASWLSEHPEIFVSNPKEPNYFNTLNHSRPNLTLQQYEKLFYSADVRHKAVGEASTRYLQSPSAIDKIIEHNPEALFIVCVRNPLDMIRSWHRENLKSHFEDQPSLDEALKLESDRAHGHQIPKLCSSPHRLQYTTLCALGSQLQRLQRQVPADKLHIVVMDDMKTEPKHEYQHILRFLGVADDNRKTFGLVNEGRRVPSWLAHLNGHLIRLKGKIGVHRDFGLSTKLSGLFGHRHQYGEQPSQLLIQKMDPEIERLEKALEREFPAWKQHRLGS